MAVLDIHASVHTRTIETSILNIVEQNTGLLGIRLRNPI